MNTSRKLLIAGATALAAAAFSSAAFAQASSTGTGQAAITILRPITVTKVTDLNFGTVAVNASGGSSVNVTMSDDANSTRGGTGAALVTSSANPPTSGHFTINGESGQSYSLTINGQATGPALAAYTLDLASGSASLPLTLTSSVTPGTNNLGGSGIGSPATVDLYIGGNITVPAGQASGLYTGVITVDASYN